jgi:hypothetical protein
MHSLLLNRPVFFHLGALISLFQNRHQLIASICVFFVFIRFPKHFLIQRTEFSSYESQNLIIRSEGVLFPCKLSVMFLGALINHFQNRNQFMTRICLFFIFIRLFKGFLNQCTQFSSFQCQIRRSVASL